MAEGHRQRLIDKVLKHGIEVLCEHEFLELCLFSVFRRRDTNTLAHELLKKFGSLENLCNATEDEIMEVDGIGRSAATYIRLIPYVSKGYSLHTSTRGKNKFTTHESICQRCIALLKGNVNETAYVLCFDKSLHLIKEVKIAEGAPGSVTIEPRKIMDAVASTSTSAVVLCHNHPSGILIPSQNDIITTQQVSEFLKTIGIEFIDHIIVADNKSVSCMVV